MNPLYAAVLGIVEGLTEFLPVSSTGHLLMAGRLLGLAQTEFLKTFEIAIQLGAIAAVAWVERGTILHDREAVKKALVAFVPTGVIGFFLYKAVKQYLLATDQIVPWALLIGGLFLIAFEWAHAYDARAKDIQSDAKSDSAPSSITYGHALIIGTVQSLAIIPGVSRSAASIVAGLALGINREAAVRFSFLVAIPTVLAAAGYDLLKSFGGLSGDDVLALTIGTVVSFFVALLTIRFLLRFVQTGTFIGFGMYRIVAALVFWTLLTMPMFAPLPLAIAAEVNSKIEVETKNVLPLAHNTKADTSESGGSLDTAPEDGLTKTDAKPVTLLAVGDIMLSRNVGSVIRKKKDVLWPYASTKGKIQQADIAFANLETSITPGRAIGTNEMSFRADPETADGLADAGFDIVSLANNHTPNFGAKGLTDTFGYLHDVGVDYAGAGANYEEAHRATLIERNGQTFAFLAYNDPGVVPASYEATEKRTGTAIMNLAALAEDVHRAKLAADVVIVSMHAGTEYTFKPNASQVAFAHAAIDAGAAAVIGHHPHVVQTFEEYSESPIFYSLGNFIFDQMWSQPTREGLMVTLSFEGGRAVAADAVAVVIMDYGQPQFSDGNRAAKTIARLGDSNESAVWHWDAPKKTPEYAD